MQNYELKGGEYKQEEMKEFDEHKLAEASAQLGKDIPEFLKDKCREEITRLNADIEERKEVIKKEVNLILDNEGCQK